MYIFLDIDGVLNKESQWNVPYSLNDGCIKSFCRYIKKVKNPKIVLTSTWKTGFEKNGKCLPQVERLLDKLAVYGVDIYDKTLTAPDNDRSKEIAYYLKRHPIEEYVILDDDKTLYSDKKHLVIINYKVGFVDADIRKIKKATGNF